METFISPGNAAAGEGGLCQLHTQHTESALLTVHVCTLTIFMQLRWDHALSRAAFSVLPRVEWLGVRVHDF